MALEHPHALLQPLALVEGEPWPIELCLRTIQALTRQVRAGHEKGRLHGHIRLQNIRESEHGQPQLLPSDRPLVLGGAHSNLDDCPPELAGANEIRLPLALPAARDQLRQHGLDIDPRRIDVYQIAAVLCRLATGGSVRAYADSPRIKATVPPAVREVLDRGLGFDSPDRLKTCNALADALDDALAALTAPVDPTAPVNVDTPPAGVASSDTQVQPYSKVLPEAAQDAPPQRRLAHYRLLELIGSGGMGEVYRAHDEQLDRIVAVKVLRQDLHGDESFIRRFHNEADAIARLPHPNLVPLYYVGEDQGRRFYAMRLIEGESLAQRLRTDPPLAWQQSIEIITQCLSALAVAHEEGLIHRDIKPANVLLERETSRAYLVDFGLARRLDDETGLTRTGVVMGTVEYLSPEQARGDKQIDQRADLYSIGVVLYQMLAGQLPFAADSAVGWIFHHVHETPRPLAELAPDLPPELIALVHQLMAKKADERPADCRAVLAALQPFQQHQARARQLSSEMSSVLIATDAAALSEPSLAPRPGPWRRIRDGVETLFHRNTPQWLDQLQSTEQQAAGAIAIYERRHRRLLALQHEGRQLLAVLREQVAAHEQAISTAREEADAAVLAEVAADARQQQQVIEQQLVALVPQVEQLAEQVDQLDLEVAKVSATLASLTSSRDAMLARLNHARPAKKERTPHRAAILALMALAMCVILGASTSYWWWPTGTDPAAGVTPPVDPLTPDPAPPIPPPPPDPDTYLATGRDHALRQRWLEARDDYEKYIVLRPDYRRVELAEMCLFANDRDDYQTHCAVLASGLSSADEYAKVYIARTLCLAPAPSDGDPYNLEQELSNILQANPQNNEAIEVLAAVQYRSGKWEDCIETANRVPGTRGPWDLSHTLPWVYRTMALWQVGEFDAARASLRWLKTFADRQQPASYSGGWFEEISVDQRLEMFAFDGLRVRIVYREASRLILGKEEELKLSPVVNAVGEMFVDPSPAVTDPNDAQVAQIVLELGGKLTVETNSARRHVEKADQLPPAYRLVGIDLTKCSGVTAEHTEQVGKLTDLESVSLLHTRIDEAAFANLSKLENLRSLDCGDTRVTAQALIDFVALPNLSYLCFGGSFDPANLPQFAKAPNLTEINISWTSVDDAGLKLLPAFSQVQTIYINRTRIQGEGLAALSRLPRLRHITLSSTPLTDAGLIHLPPALKLSKLDLEDTAIGDPSVAHLVQFKTLRQLNLKSTRFTNAGVEQLKQALPDCQITFSAAPPVETIDSLTTKIAENPQDAEALRKRAVLHQQQLTWDEASDDCEAYLKLQPADTWFHLDAALIALAAGRVDTYLQHCQLVETALLQEEEASIFHSRAARILSLRAGALTEGDKLLERAQAMAKKEPDVWVVAPQIPLLYRLGKFDEAEQLSQQIVEKHLHDEAWGAAASIWRAMALHQLGRTTDARTSLVEARELTTKQLPAAGDPAYGGNHYVECIVMLKEAEALIEP